MKLFCAGVGVDTPDLTNASRRIKKSEQELCAKNGVKDVIEVKVGYDGIVLGQSKATEPLALTRQDIFLALAKQIPGPDGKLIDNPNQTWKDARASLPATKIEVLGPPPTSGTRDAFVELAMEGGAKKYESLAKLRKSKDEAEIRALMAELGIPDSAFNKSGKKLFQAVAHGIREDGAFIEAGENDNLIVQKLEANPAAVGIFGFSFLDQNADKVKGNPVDGVVPTFDDIAGYAGVKQEITEVVDTTDHQALGETTRNLVVLFLLAAAAKCRQFPVDMDVLSRAPIACLRVHPPIRHVPADRPVAGLGSRGLLNRQDSPL